MKKVFLIHGFQGSPNGGWRPWLMSELDKLDIYACALPMPSPNTPKVGEWVEEIARHTASDDEVVLIGHSLGVTGILHYLQNESSAKVYGAVLVSGPVKPLDAPPIEEFISKDFSFDTIKSNCQQFHVIHGDDDPLVPLNHAEFLKQQLNCHLTVVHKGGHLNGQSGFYQLPEVLSAVQKMLK